MADRLLLADGTDLLLLANGVDHLLLAQQSAPPTSAAAATLSVTVGKQAVISSAVAHG